MVDAFLLAVAQGVLSQLSAPAIREVGRIWDIDHDLQSLRETVSAMKCMLLDAEKQSYGMHTGMERYRNWRDRMKDALYDAEDLLLSFSSEAQLKDLGSQNKIIKQVRTFFSSSNQAVLKVKMRSRLRKIRQKIDAIRYDNYLHFDRVEVKEEIRHEETHSHIPEGMLVGRDSDRTQILEMLLDFDSGTNVSVISIVGIGGMGKTALAQSAYNDEIVQEFFELRKWIYVSCEFREDTIIKQIIPRDKSRKCRNLNDLQESLRREIKHKRFLFILDDLWNTHREKWLRLKNLLDGGAQGSKILITTRNLEVARASDSRGIHNLQCLSDEASLELFKQMAFEERQEMNMMEKISIGREVISKCGGVPLLIRLIGGMLFALRTRNEWLNFLHNELPRLKEKNMVGFLELSYRHLPTDLKPCFLLCSLFPKGNVIDVQKLMDLWTVHRLIPSASNPEHNLKVRGQDYCTKLESRNFFQDKEVDGSSAVSYKMQDLLHDLACNKAQEECKMIGPDPGSTSAKLRHLSYGSNNDLSRYYKKFAGEVRKVRTLFFVPNVNGNVGTLSMRTCRKLISNLRCLRLLTLHNTDMRVVPSSLSKLKLLCHLDLSYNEKLEQLPKSIKRLQNLVTLKLIECHKLKELPQDIGELASLQHLDLGYDCSLNHMPHGLGKLTSLCTLTHFIPGESKLNSKNHAALSELKSVDNLRGKLEIIINGNVKDARIESKEADMKAKHLIEELVLKWGHMDENKHNEDEVIQNHEIVLEGLQPHSNLRSLHISKYKGASFPTWLLGDNAQCLPNLTEVNLVGCERCRDLSQLGLLPQLKILSIIGASAVESIGDPCPETEASGSEITSALPPFPSLVELKIHDCPKLKSMPPIQNLESLDVRNVSEELLNHSIPLRSLRSLRIERIDNLESLRNDFLQNLISLADMRICECPRLTSLSLGLEHLSSLTRLSISKCELLDLSIDENGCNMPQIKGLVKLHCLNLFSLPKLTSLPGWLFHIATLEQLQIWDCLNLTALSERMGDLVRLQRLEIHSCPNLASLPASVSMLGSLEYLEIQGCQQLERRCKIEEGEDWCKIAHVPAIWINYA